MWKPQNDGGTHHMPVCPAVVGHIAHFNGCGNELSPRDLARSWTLGSVTSIDNFS